MTVRGYQRSNGGLEYVNRQVSGFACELCLFFACPVLCELCGSDNKRYAFIFIIL